jgi:GMP synthase-like glutamine amidotransferase
MTSFRAFHPEVEHTDNGYEMFQAFIDICEAKKKKA